MSDPIRGEERCSIARRRQARTRGTAEGAKRRLIYSRARFGSRNAATDMTRDLGILSSVPCRQRDAADSRSNRPPDASQRMLLVSTVLLPRAASVRPGEPARWRCSIPKLGAVHPQHAAEARPLPCPAGLGHIRRESCSNSAATRFDDLIASCQSSWDCNALRTVCEPCDPSERVREMPA